MGARSVDLLVEQGADYRVEFPDLDEQDRPRNRVGWSAQAAIRHSPDTGVLAKPQVTLQPGRVVVVVPGAASAGWAWRRARYEVRLVGPLGERERFAAGRVLVDPTLVR